MTQAERTTRCRTMRGAVLLEVVLALTLFIVAAMVVLGGIGASTDVAEDLRQEAMATDLAITVLSELQIGPEARDLTEPGPAAFEEPFQNWTWELITEAQVEQLGGPTMQHVTIVIRHAESGYEYRLSHLFVPQADLDEAEEAIEE